MTKTDWKKEKAMQEAHLLAGKEWYITHTHNEINWKVAIEPDKAVPDKLKSAFQS